MNEILLTILILLLWYNVLQICTGAFDYGVSQFREVSTLLTIIIFGFGLIFSIVLPTGYDKITMYPATNTRVGDQLIIQAENVPTQISSDISLINKPVQIKKISENNAWGGCLQVKYEIEIIKTEL